jgi:hypothetical protein
MQSNLLFYSSLYLLVTPTQGLSKQCHRLIRLVLGQLPALRREFQPHGHTPVIIIHRAEQQS